MLDEIKNRASVRNFTDKKISDNDLREILTAGQIAPSWMNVQPWKFIVIKNPELRKLVNELCFSQSHVEKASDLIVVIADLSAWDKEHFGNVLKANPRFQGSIDNITSSPMYNPKVQGDELAKIRTAEQCGYAIENMVLQAKNLNISSCIIGALGNEFTNSNLELYKKVKEIMKLSEDMKIFNVIALGYAENDVIPEKIRKDFDDIVFKDNIDTKF